MPLQAGRPLSPSDFVRLVEDHARRGDAAALVELLDEQHPIYEEQPSRTIVSMRGWILVQLSRGELPASALPFVLEELETSAEAYLVGAAALALRAWPQPLAEFVPFVLRALDNVRGHDQPLSFERYGAYADSATASCAVQELLRAAAWLGRQGEALAPRLRSLEEAGGVPSRLRDLRIALQATASGPDTQVLEPECCPSILEFARSSWLPSSRRARGPIENTRFEDQSGTEVSYADMFVGRPTIVAFFYTRCDNPLKCSLTVWKLAQVQKELDARGLTGRIRTAAITYDPEFDSPDRLRVFGRNRELRMDSDNRLLRTVHDISAIRSHFRLGVSFAGGLVNRHRIEMFLLDRHGRIARSFQRLHWNPQRVVDEAVSVWSEPDSSTSHISRLASSAGPLGAVAVALLPKCPMCWSAYLSSAGLTAVAGSAYSWTYQLVSALLLVHLASMFWRARSTRQWLGFSLSLAGGAFLLTSSRWDPTLQPLATAMVAAGAILGVLGRSSSWLSRFLPFRPTGTREISSLHAERGRTI